MDAAEIGNQLAFFEALKANTLTALRNGAEAQDIALPDMYSSDRPGFIESTRKRWFAYYQQREGRA